MAKKGSHLKWQFLILAFLIMAFCYQHCSDLLCSSDREKILKFEAEGREFAKILRSPDQFIETSER